MLKEIYLGGGIFCLLWITLVRLLLFLVLLHIASVSFVKSTFGNCKAAKFYLGGLANHLHISSHTSCLVSAIVHLQSKLFVIQIQKSAISPPSIKGISDDEEKSGKAHLLVSEPGSLDSVGSNEEGGADDDGTGRDKGPEVLAHQPDAQKSCFRSPFLEFQ